MQNRLPQSETKAVLLPTSTPWPLVLALGLSLLLTGLVTHAVIGILGVVLMLAATVGWFLQVLPHEAHHAVAVDTDPILLVSARTLSDRPAAAVGSRRAILPVETFRFSTGIRGGIAGGIWMTIPAAIYGLSRYHSVWYAANLLAAGGFVSWANASDAFLSQFHIQGLLAALAIHTLVSLGVGMLYGALLPMFPRYPILTAGVVTPLLFTGIMYSALGIISPILNARIDWLWFVLSQITFGLVCGFVVNFHAKIRTPQYRALPFSIRAGIHSDRSVVSDKSATSSESDSGQEPPQ
jgi:hypothetical protein